MPHPDRSPSSPSLRDTPKRAADELLLPRSGSMPCSGNGSRSSSFRCMPVRRPRPSVASIADLFVSSLVLAGFCHDHSPRSRGFCTLSSRASQGYLHRGRVQCIDDRSRLSYGRRREFSNSPDPLVQSSRSRPWLGYGLAHAKDESGERRPSRFRPIRERKEEKKENGHPMTEPTQGPMRQPFQDRFFDSVQDDYPPLDTKQSASDDLDSTADFRPNKQPSPTYNERVQRAVTHLLRRLLGSEYDSNDAVEAMMTYPPPLRANDNTRDVMESPSVAKLVEMLPSEQKASTQMLFRLYRDLPSPGVAYLSKASRGTLLRRLANPPDRRAVDARRYLALVEDMKRAGLPMSRSLWSSAIYMAGRSSNGRVSKQRLVEAVGLWQQMEHIANIEADDVVFTILFEIAVKANQFVVAERLEQEMKRRGLRFERWGLVTKIFSYGVRKNAEGVRATFDEFVSSGELVDTVVLNCVMASFLRAGDTVTAKSIYAQMLEAQTAQKAAPSNPANLQDPLPSLAAEFPFYRSKTKQLGSMLKKSKHLRARLPAFHSALQDSLPMTPDTRTFYIWLQHCARRSGNLKMFMQVLEDMERSFAVPPRHMIYILLFEGFALHGRAHKTTPEWTRERLRLTWLGFIRAVRDSRARHLGLYRNAPTMTWDNPLRSASDLELDTEAEVATVNSSTKPGDLYVPLLSTLSEAPSAVEDPAKANESSMEPVNHGEQDLSYQEEELSEGSEFFTEDDFEYDEVSDASEIPENNDGPLETLENNFEVPELPTEQDMGSTRENVESPSSRLDNGVFVGRRISIAILQAFGTCCGPDEVMEAWLQLEELWPPSKRTALDMLIMREVVEDQMARKHR